MRKRHDIQHCVFIGNCDLNCVVSYRSPRFLSAREGVPPDVLELLPKGYVYADYPGVFDDIEGDGLTFETWIYLTARPKERQNGFGARRAVANLCQARQLLRNHECQNSHGWT